MKEPKMKASVGERIVQRLQGFTEALENDEVISERFTCRKIILDLRPSPYEPKLVKETRKRLGVSQALFAQFLGVALNTVQAWEQGTNTPSAMASRFMDEIRCNPEYYIRRIREVSVAKRIKKRTGGAG